MTVTRRQMLTGGAAGVGLAVAGSLPALAETPAGRRGGAPAPRPATGRPFPPLQDDPDGILALPAGFSYRVVTRTGRTDLTGGLGKTPATTTAPRSSPPAATGCGWSRTTSSSRTTTSSASRTSGAPSTTPVP